MRTVRARFLLTRALYSPVFSVWARYFTNGMNNHEAGEYEAGQAKAAIRACVEAGAKHIVYSTLDDAEVAPHMSYKAKGEHCPACCTSEN
jgi:hypothetical protein